MFTAAQLRAARGLLDWTRSELAKASGLSQETIKNIEHGTYKPQESTIEAIIRTFAAHDIEFLENEGVRKSEKLVKTFSGTSGYIGFLEDIMSTMKNGGKTRQFNLSDALISTYGSSHLKKYNEVMQAVTDLDAKCLVPEGDTFFPVQHCVYKWLKKIHEEAVPYYLYGNKIAMLTSSPGQEIQFVVIYSESLAQTYYNSFDVYWKESKLANGSK
jgi:DNA-binding XRE family transcriptional regulator